MAYPDSPGWYWDPATRHQYRYFDGARWTEHVADNGIASTDLSGTTVLPQRRRFPRTIVALAIAAFAVPILLYVIAGIMFETQGVDPDNTLEAKKSLFSSAGVTCMKWSEGSNDMVGVGASAWGTCTLPSGESFRITTFREESNKSAPAAPCPRVEGPRFWIDTSRVRDRATERRLAAALGGTVVTTCPTPTT